MKRLAVVLAVLALASPAEAKKKKKKSKGKKKPAAAQPAVVEEPPPPPEPVVEEKVVEAPSPEPAAAPAPPPVAPTAVSAVYEPATPPRSRPLVTVRLAERPFWRRLRYRDNLDETLRPSDLTANAIAIDATVRPVRALTGFGITAHFERAFGVNGSRTSDGMGYGTTSQALGLDARIGGRVGPVDAAVVLGAGEQRFTIDDEGMAGGELLPDVVYRYVRAGADVTMALAPKWELGVSGGYRHLISMGDLTDAAWFPRAEGAGVDATASITFLATPWLGIYAALDMRRYFFTMNPEVGDPWIAGGAIDQYLGAFVGLSVRAGR